MYDRTVTDTVSVPTGERSPNALAGNISPDAGISQGVLSQGQLRTDGIKGLSEQ